MGNIVALLVVSFIICLALRVPIAISLGISSFLALVFGAQLDISYFIQTMFQSNNSFTLLAVPFFILAGDLMLAGGVSERLVKFVKMMMNGTTGALAIITVVACMIFAAISGSGPATVAAMGGILIPAMIKAGYDTPFACSLASCAGSLGPVIPPSVIFVMYGVTVQQSISDLFIAGIMPGILVGVVLMIYSVIKCKRHNWGVKGEKASAAEKFQAFKGSIWALLVPVIILGGIYSGVFTPTEAAVVACVYAMIIGFVVYRELTIKKLYKVFVRSTLTLGTTILIVAFATALGRVLTITQIPQALASAITVIASNRIMLLLLINIFLFFVGMFMESLSAILILAPLLMPVASVYGVDPVHFGVIMTVSLAMGQVTPPVGVCSYVASSLGGIKIDQMIKPLIPLVLLMFLSILLISFVPAISMWPLWLMG